MVANGVVSVQKSHKNMDSGFVVAYHGANMLIAAVRPMH